MIKKIIKINNLVMIICFIFLYSSQLSISEDNQEDDLVIKSDEIDLDLFYFDIINSETAEKFSNLPAESIETIIDSIVFMFWIEYTKDPNKNNENAKIQLQKAKAIIEQVKDKEKFVKKQKLYVDLLETYIIDRNSKQTSDLANEIGDIKKYIKNESEIRKETIQSSYNRLLTNLITSLSEEGKFLEAQKYINKYDGEKDNHFYQAMQSHCRIEDDKEKSEQCYQENLLLEIKYNQSQIVLNTDNTLQNLVRHHNLFYNFYDLAVVYNFLEETQLQIEAYDNFYSQIENILSYDNKTYLTKNDKSFLKTLFSNKENKKRIADYLNFLIIQNSEFHYSDLAFEVEYDQEGKENEIVYGERKFGTFAVFKIKNVNPKSVFYNYMKEGDYILSINNHDLYDTHISDLAFYEVQDFIPILFKDGNNEVYIESDGEIKLIKFNLEKKTIEKTNLQNLYNNAFRASQIIIYSTASQSLNKFYERKLSQTDPLLIKKKQDLLYKEKILKKKLLEHAWVADHEIDGIGDEMKEIKKKIDQIDERIISSGGVNKLSNFQRIFDLGDVINLLNDDEVMVINFEIEDVYFQWIIRSDGFVKLNKILPDNRLDELFLLNVNHAIKNYRNSIDEKIRLINTVGPVLPADIIDHEQNLHSTIAASRGIYYSTIEQIEKYFADRNNIILLSYGSFSEIPFSSLFAKGNNHKISVNNIFKIDKGDFLNEKYNIYNIINLQSLEFRSRYARSSDLNYVGIANPKFQRNNLFSMLKDFDLSEVAKSIFRNSLIADRTIIENTLPLPETADEISSISKNFSQNNVQLLFQNDASEKNIKNMDLSKVDVINIATHTIPSIGTNEPGLMLALPKESTFEDDGVLTPAEISNLNLNAKLVVLSACNTASGTNQDTEVLSGLAQAFIYAGAENIIVSHWNVETNSTVELMTNFYQYWLESGIKPQIALSLAKQDMMKSKDYNHPFYWAGFSYYGL